jgi:hypothetical protein
MKRHVHRVDSDLRYVGVGLHDKVDRTGVEVSYLSSGVENEQCEFFLQGRCLLLGAPSGPKRPGQPSGCRMKCARRILRRQET